MKTYAILRRSDSGKAMPCGFVTTTEGPADGSTQLALVSALLDSLGYYMEFEEAETPTEEKDILALYSDGLEVENPVEFESLDDEEKGEED